MQPKDSLQDHVSYLFVRVVRYMKYATAVYGETMIRAAEMDVLGKLDNRLSPVTRTRISEHCSIPVEDIVLMDVDYGGDVSGRWLTSRPL
jgi:hypothetical protein